MIFPLLLLNNKNTPTKFPIQYIQAKREKYFTTMVHKRFSKISFFLGLLFVMHGRNMGSSALHEGKDEIATMSGGRKLMGALKEIVRELGPDNHVVNGGISKISGVEMKASNSPRRSQESLNSQAGPAIEETDNENNDETSDDRQRSSGTSVNEETRRLLEAAKEMVSLMHKDYQGFGRRKPPINNNEPSH